MAEVPLPAGWQRRHLEGILPTITPKVQIKYSDMCSSLGWVHGNEGKLRDPHRLTCQEFTHTNNKVNDKRGPTLKCEQHTSRVPLEQMLTLGWEESQNSWSLLPGREWQGDWFDSSTVVRCGPPKGAEVVPRSPAGSKSKSSLEERNLNVGH